MENNMQEIKKLVEETLLKTLEVLGESDDHPVMDKVKANPHMPKHYNDRMTKMHQTRHSSKGTMTKLRKGMSDHEKKHMAGAYFDDDHIVHSNTSKTMSKVLDEKGEKSKNFGQVRKEIQAHIAKHHPE